MKRINGEPTNETLNTIYMKDIEVPININGAGGVISCGAGGYGAVSIIVTFPDTIIIARERESEDSEDFSDYIESADYDESADWQPDRLELYYWQRDDEYNNGIYHKYYRTIEDAMTRKNPRSRAL